MRKCENIGHQNRMGEEDKILCEDGGLVSHGVGPGVRQSLSGDGVVRGALAGLSAGCCTHVLNHCIVLRVLILPCMLTNWN